MDLYLSKWRWVSDGAESYYAPPEGAIGALDLGLLPEMAIPGVPRKGCLFWSNQTQPKEHVLIANGDPRDVKSSTKIKQRFKSLVGYSPDGDTLDAMVMDCLIGGADPEGLDAPMPIMPDQSGWMALHLPGIGNVKNERCEAGKTPHWNKVRTLIVKQLASLADEADGGKLRDVQLPEKVLDAWCGKFGFQDGDKWKNIVPAAMQKRFQNRIKHETSYSHDFNRADSGSLGSPWSTLVGPGHDIFSNQARATSGTSSGIRMRYGADLSSSDMYSEMTAVSYGATNAGGFGCLVRCASAADTSYGFLWRVNGTPTRRLFKNITGTATLLSSDSTAPPSLTFVGRAYANGSSIKGYENGVEVTALSITDSSIPGNLRAGFQGQLNGTDKTIIDNWSCSDLAPSGTLYTQLERGIRGLRRGTYVRYGG